MVWNGWEDPGFMRSLLLGALNLNQDRYTVWKFIFSGGS